jgi:hypothetical protein
MIHRRAFPLVTTASKELAAARFEERFGVLKELMLALDVVPLSGQEDLRDKMLLILRGEGLRLESPMASADLLSLSNAMTELEHEVGRFASTPGLFNRHVEIAIGALRRTVCVPASAHQPGLATRRLPSIDTTVAPCAPDL